MPKVLIMLSTPRSFSSVVSTMIGEHPEIYGFPELHLFNDDIVQQAIDRERRYKKRHVAAPPGLLRAIAQIHDGVQNSASVIRAIGWLQERLDWSTQGMMDYLFEAVAPKMSLEKSPITAAKPEFLERTYSYYPDAFYLHLTRHPVSARSSWIEFDGDDSSSRSPANRLDRFIGWYFMHTNILRFTSTLPMGQTMRVKGEDLLSDPDLILPQIAQWLGIRSDTEAIEAMKQPENSPYACPGPPMAVGGNDPKFMRSPKLRAGRVKEPNLQAFFANQSIDWFPQGLVREAATQSGLQVARDEVNAERITEIAHLLGYT